VSANKPFTSVALAKAVVTAAGKGYVPMFRYSLVVVGALWGASAATADSWADALFEELSKDFGSVPHGPTLSHPFRLTNNTPNQVHIAGARVSCGCVSATVQERNLAPGQSTVVQTTMDTRRFYGTKRVTIYVQFDQPQWDEVRLWVQANSRDDLTVTPEAFTLGKAKRGSSPSASVTVSLRGSDHWQILELQRESNYVQASIKELTRTATEVSYQITASIRADAPVGKWYSDLWLKTNNPALSRVRVPLTVEIEPPLSVSPSAVDLGQVKPGAEVQRKLILRGDKPFRVTKVEGTDDQVQVLDSSPESKPVHVLTITLKPASAGDFNRTLKVITDLKEEGEIEFQAKAQISK
jgi:hypothetical protein